MASNYSNYFFKASSPELAYDEYVYGSNTSTGSGNFFTPVSATGSIVFADKAYAVGTYSPVSGAPGYGIKIIDSAGKEGVVYYKSSSLGPNNSVVEDPGVGVFVIWNSSARSDGGIASGLAVGINLLRTTYNGPKIVATTVGGTIYLTQQFGGQQGNTVLGQDPSPATAFATPADATYNSFQGGRVVESISWNPTTGTVRANGTEQFDSFVLSPLHHGHFFDMVESPPERYYFSRLSITSPPIKSMLATSSYSSSLNQDQFSRVFSRYVDR